MENQQFLNSKKEIHDRINWIHKFDAILNYDFVTKKFKLIIEGTFKDGTMAKSALTQWDWERIADLITTSITTAIKPIQNDIKAIKSCPTIKKEFKSKNS